jgi:hypothetical protein
MRIVGIQRKTLLGHKIISNLSNPIGATDFFAEW